MGAQCDSRDCDCVTMLLHLQEPTLLLRSPGAVAAVLAVLRTTFKLDMQSLLQVTSCLQVKRI